MTVVCFQNHHPLGWCCQGPWTITEALVLHQVERGWANCPSCGVRGDLTDLKMPIFGQAEALFGVQGWHFQKELPATTTPQVAIIDPTGEGPPPDGRLVYAHMTPHATTEFDDHAAMFLAP